MKTTEELLELLRIDSPTGMAEKAVVYVEDRLKALGVSTRRTKKGALLATLEGREEGGPRALTAHVDTLGAMVKELKPNGRVKLTNVGGLQPPAVEGEYCRIYTRDGGILTGTGLPTKASAHVHGQAYSTLERTWEHYEVRLDAVARSVDDLKGLGIEVGDFVAFDPRPQATPAGYVKSRFLDDKASVAILLGVLRRLKEGGHTPARKTHLLIAIYEEVGHGCPAGLPEVDELVAVDMAAIGEGQTSDEHCTTVCAKDSGGPYDLELTHRLVDLGKSEGLDVRTDIYPFYGSDATAAARAGRDTRIGLVGPGVDASHSHERTHEDALEATERLLVAYLLSPGV